MSKEEKAELADRVRIGVAMMRVGFSTAKRKAKPDAVLKFACVVVEPGGGGRVGMTFEADEFLADIDALVALADPP